MKKVYLILLLLCLNAMLRAQTAANYFFTMASGSYTSISGTGSAITSGGMISDDSYSTVPLGMNFVFCGTTYSGNVNVSANGWFSLGGSTVSSGGTTYTNSLGNVSGHAGGVGFLMPLWDDLYGGTSGGSGTAYYQTVGSVGSRIFTMEWNNWSTCCSFGSATLNFQVKLYEGTNRIEFWYGPGSGSTGATIGIANSGSDYLNLSSSSSTSASNSTFYTSLSYPANGTVFQWCPTAAITGNTGPICIGSGTLSLTNSISGGTWSSGATSVATVTTGGVVSGASAGSATISYTTPCGAVITTVVTVNASPAAITGTACANVGGTTSLNDATSGGTWSSSLHPRVRLARLAS